MDMMADPDNDWHRALKMIIYDDTVHKTNIFWGRSGRLKEMSEDAAMDFLFDSYNPETKTGEWCRPYEKKKGTGDDSHCVSYTVSPILSSFFSENNVSKFGVFT